MSSTYRKITRSGLAERLGLHGADLTPRQGSTVMDTSTKFLNANGECIGMHTRALCAITGRYEDEFFILTATSEPEYEQSQIWL